MTIPSFDIGDKVVLVGPLRTFLGSSVYQVIGLLPPNHGEPCYRVRSIDDPADRIVGKRELAAHPRRRAKLVKDEDED